MFNMKKNTPWSFFLKKILLFYSKGSHYSTSKSDLQSLFFGGQYSSYIGEENNQALAVVQRYIFYTERHENL